MSWYQQPKKEHVRGPCAVISSKKNISRMNVSVNTHQRVNYGESRGISLCIRRFFLAQIGQFRVLAVPLRQKFLQKIFHGHDRSSAIQFRKRTANASRCGLRLSGIC
ncbi:hypothetical protein AVEN_174191-1 [Araneus ventricosus]|uniref:Uncharacterized protein n=1 Tax=Araneus ventricosus TaxID=182803 RepID=A0A4Y2RJF3_ARAVE|nr:hypothetical protein AVEN_174191-1 [Araneus ventricosus]